MISEITIYSASQKKQKPINHVKFSENYHELSKKVYIVTKLSLIFLFLLTHSDHAWPSTISNGDVKIDLRGLPRFSTKGCVVEKTFIGISFVCFVIFLLLRLLILTWIS